MNANRQTALIQESQTQTMASKLICWAGLPLVVAGIFFAGIQPIHPADVIASVTTSAWAIITPLKTIMSLFFMLGITGLYARQVNKAGWLGLVGFLLFSLCWALQTAYIFAEAFILPVLVTTSPQFVDGILGAVSGRSSQVDLGLLPALYNLVGILYMLGGLLFGIATYRAGVLSRWAGGLLALTAVLTPLAALLPHNIQRLTAMPMGLALAWLGYALWSEWRETTVESLPGKASPQLRQAEAK